MERIIKLTIEKLPEGPWLGTSDDVQGLLVQADNLTDLVNWAQQIARDLIEMHAETNIAVDPEPIAERFELPLVIAA